MRKTKIVFVLENYYPSIGGVEKLFKNLADKLSEDKHEVLVITHKSQRHLPSFEIINGVAVKRLPFSNRFAFTFFSLPWILYYGRGFDYFHTTSYNAAVPAFLASKLLRKNCFITFHEYWGKLWFKLPHLNLFSRFLFYWYEKMISKFSFKKFVAVSDYTRQSLIKCGINANKVELIYNGIDYARFDGFHHLPPSNFTITYFGRIGVSKGVDILLQAAKIFLREHSDAILKLIVPLRPEKNIRAIKTFIEQNNLSRNIVLLHQLTDEQLKTELCNSSCVVIPSYSEGFCFAAVEVIAMGIPLISSDKGALKEVVSGTYIKTRELNAVSLVNAFQNAKAGNWTISPVKCFSLDECVERYKELYK